jgi:hypothetical protein
MAFIVVWQMRQRSYRRGNRRFNVGLFLTTIARLAIGYLVLHA